MGTGREPGPPRGRRDGLLESLCWCERAVVLVRPADVAELSTASCGRPECHDPDETPGGDE